MRRQSSLDIIDPASKNSVGGRLQPALADAPLLSDLPDFDVTTALGRLHGNRELLVRFLRAFGAQHGDTGRQVAHWLASDSLAQAAGALHDLKGVSGTLGLESISTAARALEVALEKAHESRESSAAQASVQRCLARLDACLAEAVSGIATIERGG